MKQWPVTILVFGAAASVAASAVFFAPARSLAADGAPAITSLSAVKLPYAKGKKFIVTQGYNTPPTHIKKDLYALDFTQNGCDAYGKTVVAAASGTAMFVSQKGYNGGYGTELIIDHGRNIVSRYAHMIPDSLLVAASGTAIRQGQPIGLLGDTGLVMGAACADHPGTHLHFAMDTVNDDGTFSAYDPEPISGYTNILAGNWYLSDNDDVLPASSSPSGEVLGAYDDIPIDVASADTTDAEVLPSSTNAVISTGGVSVTVESAPASTPASTSIASPTTDATDTPPVATSTPSDATSTSDIATSTPEGSSSTPLATTATSSILFEQLDDSAGSRGSWYEDNWFTLGNGLAGTLNALTLDGLVNCDDPYASHVFLQEFKDKNYSVLVRQFLISDSAPFTEVMATTTFSGLFIPLKPYFYYRIATGQDRQNCSVILAGTPTTTIGTMMWDNFIYGAGRVESTSSFFPFVQMEGIAATSTLVPPSLTSPSNISGSFDEFGMQLNLSWATSTDPDWPANPLHYEMNYSTSTLLSDGGWTSVSSIPVAMGNSYLIGIRAADDYGAISAMATTTWNFPPGFAPYLLSTPTNYANQYFAVSSTSTLQSIELFTANFGTNAKNPYTMGCSLAMFYTDSPVSYIMFPADNSYAGYDCQGHLMFSFASSSIPLIPGKQYQWIFQMPSGNPLTGASVQFYGTATDTAGGRFNDSSIANAKFVVSGDSGVLFSN